MKQLETSLLREKTVPIIIPYGYTQDGTTVKVTLFADTLTLYNESEKFTDLTVNVYDTDENVVSTETITVDEAGDMGMEPAEETVEGTEEIEVTEETEQILP